jgi:hypothetical protein
MSVPDYFDIRQLGELLNQNIWTSLTPTYSASYKAQFITAVEPVQTSSAEYHTVYTSPV